MVREEHTSPTGKLSPAQVTLDRWEGLRASQGRSCPSKASQPVQPWDFGGLSQGVPQLEVVTFCFLLGRAVICILLREDSVLFLLGWLFFFFWFLLFFRSLSKVTALPPTHQIPHLPLESCCSSPAPAGHQLPGWRTSLVLAPRPAPCTPTPPSPAIRHSGGCWVSAQSHLWTNTVSSLTMRISNDPFTFLEKLPFNFVSLDTLCFFFFFLFLLFWGEVGYLT